MLALGGLATETSPRPRYKYQIILVGEEVSRPLGIWILQLPWGMRLWGASHTGTPGVTLIAAAYCLFD